MNRKFKVSVISLFILAAIVATLFYNRSKMAANAKGLDISSYPVSITTIHRERSSAVGSLVGTIGGNHDVAIASEAAGKVVAVHAEVGDYKRKGDVLIQIDDELKHAAFISAEVNYDKTKKDFDRFDALQKEHAVTDQQYESARLAFKAAEAQYITAKRQYEDTKVTSPIDGIVTARLVDLGAWVSANNIVANVVDLSTLKVKVNVAESDAFRLHAGDQVDLTTDVYPGVTFSARIKSVSAKADEAHTYPAEVELANSKEHPLKAGMFALVTFHTTLSDSVIIVPRMALVGSAKNPTVYIVQNGTARLRPIVVGRETGTNLEVLSGVLPGEQVVVSGQGNLKDNTAVTIAD